MFASHGMGQPPSPRSQRLAWSMLLPDFELRPQGAYHSGCSYIPFFCAQTTHLEQLSFVTASWQLALRLPSSLTLLLPLLFTVSSPPKPWIAFWVPLALWLRKASSPTASRRKTKYPRESFPMHHSLAVSGPMLPVSHHVGRPPHLPQWSLDWAHQSFGLALVPLPSQQLCPKQQNPPGASSGAGTSSDTVQQAAMSGSRSSNKGLTFSPQRATFTITPTLSRMQSPTLCVPVRPSA
mmetsp:Transcript_88104/g.285136  ORF Transcript_88104/g.285136 Transcript_88104/m.285136 type:complete len:237 (-) Transcript_88104:229-939(-)